MCVHFQETAELSSPFTLFAIMFTTLPKEFDSDENNNVTRNGDALEPMPGPGGEDWDTGE